MLGFDGHPDRIDGRLGPLEHVAVKNESDTVEARRLLGVTTEQRPMGRQSGAMLGRDSEMHNLLTAFAEAEKRGLLVGVVGSAGVGKSRLVAEFSSAAVDSGADPVVARCESHTAGVPLRALARLLRALFGVVRLDDAVARDRITGQLGAFLTSDSEHTRVLFELLGVAADRHGGAGSDAGRSAPQAGRGDGYRGQGPSGANGTDHRRHPLDRRGQRGGPRRLHLRTGRHPVHAGGHLSPGLPGQVARNLRGDDHTSPAVRFDHTRLAAGLIGEHPTTHGLANLIATPAAGNPFFIEEIIRDLTGRGILTGSRGAYQLASELADIDVPATVQAVLAARIDRLPAPAKAIINAAAVIGSRFDLDILQALVPGTEADHLSELITGELIDQTEFLPEPVYVFRHPLVRTTAYKSQLAATRTAAHKRLAEAIQQRDPDAHGENAALIAAQLQAAGELHKAYSWHMRAADWLQTRIIYAAQLSWPTRTADLRLPPRRDVHGGDAHRPTHDAGEDCLPE